MEKLEYYLYATYLNDAPSPEIVPPPPTRPTHMKPSVKWWTLNLTQQAVSAKRGLRSPDKVGMRRRQGVRTLLSTKTTKLEARPSYTLPLILV